MQTTATSTPRVAAAGPTGRPPRNAVKLLGAIAIAWAVVLITRPAWIRATSVFAEALPADPFGAPGALLLYAVLPMTVGAYVLVMLAPGLLLTSAFCRPMRVTEWVIRGFLVAFALRWITGLVVTSSGHVWTPAKFFASDMLLTAAYGATLLVRTRRAPGLVLADEGAAGRRRALTMGGMVILATALLLPQLIWQDMHADGVEVLETGRSLQYFAMPRFPHSSGFQGLGLGIVATAFPIHWFGMLTGPVDAAARLPLLLYIPLLFAVVIELVEHASPRRLRALEEAAVVVALASFVAALVFSASYESYTADIAAPAATDSLAVFCIAATVLFLWRGETAWLVGVAVLGYFTRPSEFMVLMILAAVSPVVPRELRRGWIARVGLGLVVCVVARALYESVYVPWASGGLTPGHASGSLMQRLQYLTIDDWRRLLFVLVPSGFIPFVALFAFRRQDPASRTLAITCITYTAVFCVVAFVALHHFAPVMLLPVVVWWRVVLAAPSGRSMAWPTIACASIALLLALPPGFDVTRNTRPIAAMLSNRIGDYYGTYAGYREAINSASILDAVFRQPAVVQDPAREHLVSGLALVHYSARLGGGRENADYVAQRADDAPPAGFTLVVEQEGYAVFARDSAVWLRDRFNAPAPIRPARIYALPRATMHRHIGLRARNYDVNLATLPMMWRFFMPPG